MTCRSILTECGMFYCVDLIEHELLSTNKVKTAGVLSRSDVANLDPGGMLYLKSPIETFQINGVSFEIRVDKAAPMAHLVKNAKEFGEYYAFPCHVGWMVIKKELLVPLAEKLEEISKSDAALHALLDIEEAISKCKVIIRNIPKEVNIEDSICPQCEKIMLSPLEIICHRCFENRQGSS